MPKLWKTDWALWAITVLALIAMSIALCAVELRADEIEPLPTISATSWVAPTLQPWPPPPTATPQPVFTVYLPSISR